jgi:arginase
VKGKAVILGVPCGLGAGKQGTSEGPRAIRQAGISGMLKDLGLTVQDAGDVPVPKADGRNFPRIKNGPVLLKVCRAIESRVKQVAQPGALPVILGGDHTLAIGSISGVAASYRARKQKIGLIWVDAHADINTPQTTPSGNAHGMPLAHVLGMGNRLFTHLGGFSPKVDAANVCLVGVRDVDKTEAVNLRNSGIKVFTMKEIDRFGMGLVIESAIEAASSGTAGYHVSFDIDSVDPELAPGTGTLKRGGLTYREAHLLMEMVAESGKLLGLDMVEVNPSMDIGNRTSALAAELIASALGKTIY